MIRIAGGKNSNKGSYQITVCVKEKSLGVARTDDENHIHILLKVRVKTKIIPVFQFVG